MCFMCSFDVNSLLMATHEAHAFVCRHFLFQQWSGSISECFTVPGSFICQSATQRFPKKPGCFPFTPHKKNLLLSMAGEFRSLTAWEGKLLFSLAAQQYCLPKNYPRYYFSQVVAKVDFVSVSFGHCTATTPHYCQTRLVVVVFREVLLTCCRALLSSHKPNTYNMIYYLGVFSLHHVFLILCQQ